jgi:DNA-binding transcriptional regulator YiaG
MKAAKPQTSDNAARAAVLAKVPVVQIVDNVAVLGQQVRAHRKEQGLRIDDAAALSGVSVDLLSRLENGLGSIRSDKLLTVLEALGLALVVAPKDHDFLRHLPQEKVLTGHPAR